MKKKKDDIMLDALKAFKKMSREREIELYGHPICHKKVFRNKKIYSRKNQRIDLSFFILYGMHYLMLIHPTYHLSYI